MFSIIILSFRGNYSLESYSHTYYLMAVFDELTKRFGTALTLDKTLLEICAQLHVRVRCPCVPLKCLMKLCVICVSVQHSNIKYPHGGTDTEANGGREMGRRLAGLTVSVVNWHFSLLSFSVSPSLSVSLFLLALRAVHLPSLSL